MLDLLRLNIAFARHIQEGVYMSSIAVAQDATSPSIATRVATRVKERIVLWDGGTIAVKIPADAKRGSFDEGETHIDFLQFTRHVKNGVINLFLHGGDDLEEFRGRTVVAYATLWRKSFVDGRAFLYVDLKEPKCEREPSHRMVVVTGTSPDPLAFNTPAPLQGYVLFTKPDAKIGGAKAASTSQSLKPALGGGHKTGDGQLDRLLAAGWTQTGENATSVFLKKGDRKMTHHKPKKKK